MNKRCSGSNGPPFCLRVISSLSSYPSSLIPLRADEVEGRDVSIVHRVIKVHGEGEAMRILTKGDNNQVDDIGLCEWFLR